MVLKGFPVRYNFFAESPNTGEPMYEYAQTRETGFLMYAGLCVWGMRTVYACVREYVRYDCLGSDTRCDHCLLKLPVLHLSVLEIYLLLPSGNHPPPEYTFLEDLFPGATYHTNMSAKLTLVRCLESPKAIGAPNERASAHNSGTDGCP